MIIIYFPPIILLCLSSLDLGAPLILGRVPPEFGYRADSALPGFSGCLSNVAANGEPLDFGSPLASANIAEGCGCDDEMCMNEGVCSETAQCICTPEYTGPNCDKGRHLITSDVIMMS